MHIFKQGGTTMAKLQKVIRQYKEASHFNRDTMPKIRQEILALAEKLGLDQETIDVVFEMYP